MYAHIYIYIYIYRSIRAELARRTHQTKRLPLLAYAGETNTYPAS